MQNPYADLPMSAKLSVREAAYQHLVMNWIASTASALGWTTLEQRSPIKISVESGPFALEKSVFGRQRIQVVTTRVEAELRKLDVDEVAKLAELSDEGLKELAGQAHSLRQQTADALSEVLVEAGLERAVNDQYENGWDLDGASDMVSSARMIVASFKAPTSELSAAITR